ncbi:MAG: hypothetical protein A2W03_18605 [Candidatus Aminicenantes bacterium RBG_16_63_16]|nr:MAG: hypothetical protein A2W03_18605 [Candidatus Aminicenantes bacterium RBG_16_63_16]
MHLRESSILAFMVFLAAAPAGLSAGVPESAEFSVRASWLLALDEAEVAWDFELPDSASVEIFTQKERDPVQGSDGRSAPELVQGLTKTWRRAGHCLDCNLTLIGVCLAMGYPARWVNIATMNTYGNEVAENWSVVRND